MMTPAIVRAGTEGAMILVAEQWGAETEDVLAAGAVRISLSEILSRFSQSEPAADLRLIGEVSEMETGDEIQVFGKIGSIELRLTVQNPTSIERYRLKSAAGWFYGIFHADRFSEVAVLKDGQWTQVDIDGQP